VEKLLEQLKTIQAEVSDLDAVANLLDWDQQTYMPAGAAEGRGYHLATIQRLSHERRTSPEVGRLLEQLEPLAAGLDPDSEAACLVRLAQRDFHKRTRIPPAMVAEAAQLISAAFQAWQQARSENNFALFQPYMERVVDWRRRYADLFAPYDHIYDPLLDDYEPGMKTREVQAIFDDLRPRQVALIQKVAARPMPDDAFLHQYFEPQKQWDFAARVITAFGYDWRHGRIDKAAHPFSISFGVDDVRLTTRVLPDFLNTCMFGTFHESGHGMYDQGIPLELNRSLLGNPASYAIHESQSRLWENLVGRSLPFWEHFYSDLQRTFPAQLGGVELRAFYHGINRVKPSFIRVEADEATYNLHIMLRMELEIALVEGSLAVADLPEAWNARMQDYLGLTPPNDAQGVLQDVHWSNNYMGYFAAYALGNLISAQLWERITADLPGLPEQIRQGQFDELLGWLRRNVHAQASRYEPQALVRRITGSGIDAGPYMRYLEGKYGEIYGL
jgi:carboxypeptidase Taq